MLVDFSSPTHPGARSHATLNFLVAVVVRLRDLTLTQLHTAPLSVTKHVLLWQFVMQDQHTVQLQLKAQKVSIAVIDLV